MSNVVINQTEVGAEEVVSDGMHRAGLGSLGKRRYSERKQPADEATSSLIEANLKRPASDAPSSGTSTVTTSDVFQSGLNESANDKKRCRCGSKTNPSNEANSNLVVPDQSRAFRSDDNLNGWVDSLKDTLALCPIGHPDRAPSLNNLACALKIRFNRSGDMADLEDSIRHHRESLSLQPLSHPGRTSSLTNLAFALTNRFNRSGDIADLEEGIRHHRESLSLRPIGHAYRATSLNTLACTLTTRFERTDDLADLESIRYHQEALTLRPIGHPYRASSLNSLGITLRARFGRLGQMADLDEGIGRHREALLLHPIGHPDRASSLSNLGNGLGTRFEQTGDTTELEESILHHREAVSLYQSGHPDRAPSLNNLAYALTKRFKRNGDMANLGDSIRHHQETVSLRPIGHPYRATSLNNLACALTLQFEQNGDMADLEEGIRHHREAVSLRPIGHRHRVFSLNNLGNGLTTRFEQGGDMADLEESICYYREAVSLHPTGHPDRASSLNNLACALTTRFKRSGKTDDLEESIRHHREALSLRPIGHPDHASSLNNLGNGLTARFNLSGDITDLEESIRCHLEAVSLLPIGHPYHASSLNNLACALMTRFERGGDTADLEESIRRHQEAVSLHPIGHPYRASSLDNLGHGLTTLFQSSGDIADLEEGIRHHQEALTLHSMDHLKRASSLNNLACALATRSEQSGDMTDLEEAIWHHREALSLRPIDYPSRSHSLNNLGIALRKRFDLSGDMADLEESIKCHTDVAGQGLSSLSVRLTSAHRWIFAARQNSLESLQDAYMTYMNLFDRSLLLVASSLPDTHAHMIHISKYAGKVTEDATSHSITNHQLDTAIEIAERGRALLFTQLGNYRTPLHDLEIRNKELADRFRTLSTALERSSTLFSQDEVGFVGDQVARRQKMAASWDSTVQEIRQLDGFQNFLGVTPFTSLQKAAVDGPVILVNISHYGSSAVIVQAAADSFSVSLPGATPPAIDSLATALIEFTPGGQRKGKRSLTDILRDLWAMIVWPIVLQLETILGLSAGSRIWWMPTSAAWWLPLHAAGPYKEGERNLPDRFISSYTPTLSSLIRSRSRYQTNHNAFGPRVLVVAQAEAEGQATLPSVAEEVAMTRRLPAEVTVMEGEDCTRANVLAGLKNTVWAHFSCHGYQHPTEPFKSCFSLRSPDESVTLLDIIKNGLPQAELAVLSTCHSAAGEKTTPDEAIDLAAGMMSSGFRSVVGTMWAMDDQDGPVMAEEFYKHMFRNGPGAVDCRDAAKALGMGVRELRRRKVPLERWINFVHYGI
ncbi:hypothetical protein FRB95_009411 [Tulasnella sp. JGI-2019a]|nr:hypothetical protein FRB95_009411 [Tulasnella sp. JGI-2019a]